MKFFTAILSGSLLAASVIAAPLTAHRHARHEARRLSRVNNQERRPPYIPGTKEVLHLNKTSHDEYSSNWAGAVLIGTRYTAVTAEFTVPAPKVPSGGSSTDQYCASAWVGIDGDTCSTAILQTGIDFCVQGTSLSYDAWYEWYPSYTHTFSNITISAGNMIKVAVYSTSQTSGTATVENISTGESVTHTFSGNVTGDLCGYNAEWIVEDFTESTSLVPLANFGTVTFLSAEATGNGLAVGPSNATLFHIRQNNTVRTSSSVTSNSVTVKYL